MARIRHTCRRVKPYGTLVPDSVMPAVSVLSWPGALPRRPLEVARGRSVDRVEALIGRLAPAAICDECIVDKLGLLALQQASHRARDMTGVRKSALEGERG